MTHDLGHTCIDFAGTSAHSRVHALTIPTMLNRIAISAMGSNFPILHYAPSPIKWPPTLNRRSNHWCPLAIAGRPAYRPFHWSTWDFSPYRLAPCAVLFVQRLVAESGFVPSLRPLCYSLQVGFGLYPVVVEKFAGQQKANPVVFSFYR